MARWTTVAVLLAIGSPVTAQEARTDRLVSGNDLYAYCSRTSSSQTFVTGRAYCIGYVSAVSDTLNTWLVAEGRQAFCLPPTSNAGQ